MDVNDDARSAVMPVDIGSLRERTCSCPTVLVMPSVLRHNPPNSNNKDAFAVSSVNKSICWSMTIKRYASCWTTYLTRARFQVRTTPDGARLSPGPQRGPQRSGDPRRDAAGRRRASACAAGFASTRVRSQVPIIMLTASSTRPTGSSAWNWAPTITLANLSASRTASAHQGVAAPGAVRSGALRQRSTGLR